MSTENSPDEHIPMGALNHPSRHRTGYVERLKIQKNRLKNLHITEDTSSAVSKILPKIKKSELDRVNTTALSRGGTLESIKLPSVLSAYTDKSSKSILTSLNSKYRKKDEVFVKPFSLFPEQTMILSKSLPSLPSIPGSPGLDDLTSVIDDEIVYQPTPVYHGKHKYQTIAVRKQLERRKQDPDELNSVRSDQHYIKNKSLAVLPLEKDNSFVSTQSVPMKRNNDIDKRTLPRRYRKRDKNTDKTRRFRSLDARSDAMSVKSDSILNSVQPKWKDDCDCLRCKMIKRQFKDGDDSYKVWGQYPCQHNDDILLN
ncbi:hypothetical protein LOTGIDRAFT_235027 [Lottia gigantea]|uniref:Uncharacterized protein n=1 Tax=Lottia gigantea TaxID=225164 RepID=V3Z9F0_LOTGI|nr:hypothetical protein LOTGIDRAFT_235027 [Lottia gigantea]ESO87538.1 hypothetical protein LOTGIDRAFT_235027 [Lottia gigantea]